MNGSTLVGGGPVNPNPGKSWRAVGTGDFNDDGNSDILWQNASTGQASIWEMNGNSLVRGGPVSPNPGLAWHAVGTGDFNKDGLSRHPVAKREHRPILDMGHERDQHRRRRAGQPKSRDELARDQPDLSELFSASASIPRERRVRSRRRLFRKA
jgi:FG-GAP-like repeat